MRLRILFVDNHPEFTTMVVAAFLSAHEVVVVPTIAEARLAIERATFDVALVDYDLDDGKGDAFVASLRATESSLPVVAVSARSEGNAALMAAGATTTCAKLAFSQIQAVLAGL